MRHAQFCVHDVLHSACLLSSILPCIGLTSSLEATKTVPMQKQPVAVWWRWSRVLEAGSFRSTREAHEGQLCHFCMYCIVLKGSLEEDSRRRGWLTLEWTPTLHAMNPKASQMRGESFAFSGFGRPDWLPTRVLMADTRNTLRRGFNVTIQDKHERL